MTRSLRFALFAPLTLAIAACNSGTGEGDAASLEGEAIAAVEAPEGTEWREMASATEDGGILVGNPDAPLKLIEYASLTCPTCARFSQEGAEPLLDEYVNSGRVSFELRHFVIGGPLDLMLGQLAKCNSVESAVPLADQVWGNFQEVMNATRGNAQAFEQAMSLPEDQRFVAAAERTGMLDFFAQRGLSADRARECLANVEAFNDAAAMSQRYANEFNIGGTPTFVLNGNELDVNLWQDLEPLLQRAGAR